LLEVDLARLCLDSGLKLAPSITQFGGATRIPDGGRFKQRPVHAAKDVGQADLRRGSRQLIAAFLAPDAPDDLVRFEFDQDLHQIARRKPILAGDFIEPGGYVQMMPTRQGKHGACGIVAFDGQLQGPEV